MKRTGLFICLAAALVAVAIALLSRDPLPPKPDWLKHAHPAVQQRYAEAAAYHEQLQYIPCYCGCGEIHGSNADCYYQRDAAGQIVAYDQHSYG